MFIINFSIFKSTFNDLLSMNKIKQLFMKNEIKKKNKSLSVFMNILYKLFIKSSIYV